MDDLYQTFKFQTYASRNCAASFNIAQRAANHCRQSYILKDPGAVMHAMPSMPTLPNTVPLVLLNEDD